MSDLPMAFAVRVADRVSADYGYRVCSPRDVLHVADGGSLDEREAVEFWILRELEEYGVR